MENKVKEKKSRSSRLVDVIPKSLTNVLGNNVTNISTNETVSPISCPTPNRINHSHVQFQIVSMVKVKPIGVIV